MQEDTKYETFVKELTTVAEAKTDSHYFVLISSGNTHALEYFGLKEADTPAFVIQAPPSKFVKTNVKPKDVSSYYKNFKVFLHLPPPRLTPHPSSANASTCLLCGCKLSRPKQSASLAGISPRSNLSFLGEGSSSSFTEQVPSGEGVPQRYCKHCGYIHRSLAALCRIGRPCV